MNARPLPVGQLFDIFDQFGQALAVGVNDDAAHRKMTELMSQPDWLGDIVIRSQRAKSLANIGERLWLVADGLDKPGAVTVHVRGPFGYFGLSLEQALHRIEQFHPHDQYRLLSGIEHYFGVGPAPVITSRQTNPSPSPARRITNKRTEKESQ